jgi:hypothetical protein
MGGERPIAWEAGDGERAYEVSDRVVVAADGGHRLEERAHGLWLRRPKRLVLPAQDRACGDAKGAGGLVGRPGEKGLDPEDPEAGLGREVRSLALGDLVPARGQDLDSLAPKPGVQRLLLELCEAVEDWVARVSVLAEALGQREAQKVSRLRQGAEREAVEESPVHGGSQ